MLTIESTIVCFYSEIWGFGFGGLDIGFWMCFFWILDSGSWILMDFV